MHSRILLFIPCLLLPGCDLDVPNVEETVLRIHIERGGAGTVRHELLKVTASKDGLDGERQIDRFIATWQALASEEEEIFESGADYDANGNLNAFAVRDLKDVFQIIQEFSGSSPYRLRAEDEFQISWNGEVLTVKHHFLHPEAYEGLEDFAYRIVVSTDGRFRRVGTGELNSDQSELVITNEHLQSEPRLSFEIVDLSVRSESPTNRWR